MIDRGRPANERVRRAAAALVGVAAGGAAQAGAPLWLQGLTVAALTVVVVAGDG